MDLEALICYDSYEIRVDNNMNMDGFLTNVANGFILNKEQVKAYRELEKSFSDAWFNRNSQIAFNQRMPFVPKSNFDIDGGIEIAGILHMNSPEERQKNQEELKRQTENSYQRLQCALSNPEIKYNLEGDLIRLKNNLDTAIKDKKFTAVDNYFDEQTELSKRPEGKSITLIKLADLERSSFNRTISAKATSFAYRVASTLRNISARDFY